MLIFYATEKSFDYPLGQASFLIDARRKPRAQPNSSREPLGNEPLKRVQACGLLGMNNFWGI